MASRKPRTLEDVRAFMRANGPLETSAMASVEAVEVRRMSSPPATAPHMSSEVKRTVARVAEHLVGGLPLPGGDRDGRVDRLAAKLARLVEATSTASSTDRRRPRRAS